jgi:hypothetical protein
LCSTAAGAERNDPPTVGFRSLTDSNETTSQFCQVARQVPDPTPGLPSTAAVLLRERERPSAATGFRIGADAGIQSTVS